jgi:hypothetical protein
LSVNLLTCKAAGPARPRAARVASSDVTTEVMQAARIGFGNGHQTPFASIQLNVLKICPELRTGSPASSVSPQTEFRNGTPATPPGCRLGKKCTRNDTRRSPSRSIAQEPSLVTNSL